MIRMLFGVLIGVGLTLTLVLGNVLPHDANANDGQPPNNVTENDLLIPVRSAILSPLQTTAYETSNCSSGQFLNKLVQEYGLENLPATEQDGTVTVEMLPDIKTLNEKAVNLPLFEAGRTIQDKDIAAFYFDFLKRSGFNVPQTDGEAP